MSEFDCPNCDGPLETGGWCPNCDMQVMTLPVDRAAHYVQWLDSGRWEGDDLRQELLAMKDWLGREWPTAHDAIFLKGHHHA